MRSAARKSAGSLGALRGRLLEIPNIPRGILRKVYSAIPHKHVSNFCQVPYVVEHGEHNGRTRLCQKEHLVLFIEHCTKSVKECQLPLEDLFQATFPYLS